MIVVLAADKLYMFFSSVQQIQLLHVSHSRCAILQFYDLETDFIGQTGCTAVMNMYIDFFNLRCTLTPLVSLLGCVMKMNKK